MRITTYAYAEPPGFRPLELDVRLPDGVTDPPAVVWIHGGAWLSGSRRLLPETYPDMFSRLCRAGFAVVSLDYRLSAEARFPAQIDDVMAGFAWAVERAGALGFDGGRVAVWGESAGGHLAALLALRSRPPGRIRCAVPFYPATDFTTLADETGALPGNSIDRNAPDNPVTLLFGAPIDSVPDLAQMASPVSYVHPEAPPFLLLHGTADQTVPFTQSERLARRLREAGVPVTLRPVPGADHIFLGHPDPGRVIDRAIEFTAGHLRGA